jgi:hypothetical protein
LKILLVRVLDSVAVAVGDLEEVVAVVTEAIVTSENSTTMVVVVDSVVADLADHHLKAGTVEEEEDLVVHLPQLPMVELHLTVVVEEDMVVEDTETHPLAVDNPGGNPPTSPLLCSSYGLCLPSGMPDAEYGRYASIQGAVSLCRCLALYSSLILVFHSFDTLLFGLFCAFYDFLVAPHHEMS